MIDPYSIPFTERTANWLTILREIRTRPIEKKAATTKKINKNKKFMDKVLSMMTKEQMEGFMKGLNTHGSKEGIKNN